MALLRWLTLKRRTRNCLWKLDVPECLGKPTRPAYRSTNTRFSTHCSQTSEEVKHAILENKKHGHPREGYVMRTGFTCICFLFSLIIKPSYRHVLDRRTIISQRAAQANAGDLYIWSMCKPPHSINQSPASCASLPWQQGSGG